MMRNIPGVDDNQFFDISIFNEWLAVCKEILNKNNRLKAGLSKIGNVLYYAPKDDSGLWLKLDILEIMNELENEKILNGYILEAYNSRGAHWVDSTGKADMTLAKLWDDRSKKTLQLGFFRVSERFKDVSIEYIRESEMRIKKNE